MGNSVKEDLMQLQILENFPLLLPQNKQFSRYDGYVDVRGKQWRLSLDVPHYPSANGVQLNCDWDLEIVVQDNMTAIEELKNSSKSLFCYLEAFSKLLEKSIQDRDSKLESPESHIKNTSDQLRSLTSDESILSELRSLGSQQVSNLGADLRSVSVIAPDESGYIHEMTLKLSDNYPNNISSECALNVVSADLPKVVCDLIQKQSSIASAYDCFSRQLLSLSSVWNELHLLDSHTWIIDPSCPKKADMYRRIFIDAPKVMAHLTWNPSHPVNKPDIMFQGAEAEVNAFRTTYESNLEKWSNDCDILTNICNVLELTQLPIRQETTMGITLMQETGECCICMAAELNEKLPSVSCGQCLSCFHASCLYQWLEMLPKHRVVHGHITGDCPNCEAEVKCPDPNAATTG